MNIKQLELLVREGEGVAAAVLQKLGLSLESIRLEVEKLVQPAEPKIELPPAPIDAEKLEEKPLEVAIAKPPPEIKPPEIDDTDA